MAVEKKDMLSLDNILDDDGFNLFDIQEPEEPEEDEDKQPGSDEDEDGKETEITEVDPESMFEGSDEPESVGNDDEDNQGEDTQPQQGGDSPKSNIFSSVANALMEEGILPDLDEDKIAKIKTPEALREAIEEHIKSELDEQQQRVVRALDSGLSTNVIKQFETIITNLDSITEENLKQEGKEGDKVRRAVIYQDFINRGFTKTRAEKEVNRAFENGTEVEDAIDALESNKAFYKEKYNELIEKEEQEKAEQAKKDKERAEKFKANIMNEKNSLFGLEIDKATRIKIYENITKPIHKDKETGEVYTAVQKYELENSDDFWTKVGVLFTLTDGFKNMDKLVKPAVKKGIKKGFQDLENKLNNTRGTSGDLDFVSGVDSSQPAFLKKGVKLNF